MPRSCLSVASRTRHIEDGRERHGASHQEDGLQGGRPTSIARSPTANSTPTTSSTKLRRAVRDHMRTLARSKRRCRLINFAYESPEEELTRRDDDVLTIDQNLKGIDYQLAPCCHPIYGDPIFGFVTTGGGIKIHRTDCPNAAEMRRRFGYRIVKARWSRQRPVEIRHHAARRRQRRHRHRIQPH
jgi:(p)ppGpp synthase/HD superfamily hydrolase